MNLCEEYKGPIHQYKKLGISYLNLPTPDHFEPSLEDINRAIEFIQDIQQQQEEGFQGRVYVHCRAGHGRSASIVFAWLLLKNPNVNVKELNEQFCRMRNVRKTLWKQGNIRRFHAIILQREKQQQDDNLNSDDEIKET